MLLGFAPLIVFALLALVSVDLALWMALAAAFAVGIRYFARERLLRAFDVANLVLFGALALYAGFVEPGLSMQTVRFVIDGALFLVAVISIVRGNPFTGDYLREAVPHECWPTPHFARMNVVVASAWSLAFAVMAAADAAATVNARFPAALDSAVSLVVLALALVFTARYPAWERVQRIMGASRG